MLKENNLNLTCHTRPDRVSRGMIFNNKELTSAGSSGRANACPRMTGETGRSMVEMLGVLAVMGVLSVGGVAMYTSAMNKYRANELLNEASKRAVTVAAQISMMGKEPNVSMIAEFTNPSGYAFGLEQKNANQFNITLKTDQNQNIDSDICTQMKNAQGSSTPIRDMASDCSVITFNNDMSTTVFASDFSSETECRAGGKTWCSGQGTDGACSDSSDCCANANLSSCQECDSETGEITNLADGTTCNYNGTNDGECYLGHCNPQGCPNSRNASHYVNISPEDCAKCFGAVSSSYGCFACPQQGQNLSWPGDSSCSACDGAIWAAGHCAICDSNKVITLDYGSCVSCPAEGSSVYPTNESDCLNKCSGASWTNNGCHRCTSNQMLRLDNGSCVSCPAEGSSVSPVSESDCLSKCSGTSWRSDGLCIRCANGIIRLDTYSCVSCPAEGSSVSPVNQSDCLNKCSGASWTNNSCHRCAGNQMVSLDYGSCVSCPAEGSSVYPVSESDCSNKCSGADWNNYTCSK